MIIFFVVGGIGLVLLGVSLVFGEIFESFDIGDGAISGLAMGIGAVVFGASGVLALSGGLATIWAYVIAVAIGALALLLTQQIIRRLAAGEDAPPPSLEGAFGVLTATTGPDGGEVRLEGVRDLEARLAWSDEVLSPGTRVYVVTTSGSRVQVAKTT